jgi:hypothetical protein
MVRKIISLLLLINLVACTSTAPVIDEKPKIKKYRIVVVKNNGEKIISKTQ